MKKSMKDQSVSSASREGVAARAREAQSVQHDRVAPDVQIRARAYEIYLERGDRPGNDLSDWLQAEREYRDALR